MQVWRISRAHYDELDGEGARRNGGRWNSEGIAVIYASGSLSLAALEYLVHVDPGEAPDDLVAMTIEVPDGAVAATVDVSDLPRDWNRVSAHPACLRIGDAWATAAESLILRVPSAIVPEEENLLLNPRHAEASKLRVIRLRPFSFDPRLLPTITD